MNLIRKIAGNITLLAISILLLGVNAIAQIVLPAHKQKGNMISIIFSFLIEVTEEIFVFERSILSRSWMLQQNFIKRGLVIAAAFFFLLSSFEWVVADQKPLLSNVLETVQTVQEQPIVSVKNDHQNKSLSSTGDEDQIADYRDGEQKKYSYHSILLPQKRYLINRSFLI